MEFSGQTVIFAPRGAVWEALNDPAVLARCIDGVESLEETAPDRFEGRVVARVGPVRATFTGLVTITEAVPPQSYRLIGEGKGGAAGFAKGEAEVTLSEEAERQTRLDFTARANVGGKLAQLGGRLIEGTAKGYADRFFAALKAELEGDAAAGPGIAVAAEPADIGPDTGMAELIEATPALVPPAAGMPGERAARSGVPLALWAGVLAVLVLVLLVWLLRG